MSSRKKREGEAAEKLSASMERNWAGVFVPKKVWLSLDLTWPEKILLLEIHSFEMKSQACFKSNIEFGALLGDKSASQASRIISGLIKGGWLKSKITYKKGKKQVDKRFLATSKKFLNLYQPDEIDLDSIGEKSEQNQEQSESYPICKNADTPICKNADTLSAKMQTPYLQKCVDNIPSEYTYSKNESSSCVPRQESGVNVQARLKTKITADWQPDQSCLDRIQLSGVPREFAFECMPEFISYWLDRGTAKESWHSTFTQAVKRSWEHARANPKPANQPQATRIPNELALDAERMAISQRLAPDLMNDIDLIFNRFVAHYRSSTGEKALSADWDAQWVKWLTSEVKQQKRPAFKTKRDSLREAYEADMAAIMTDVSWANGA